MSAAGRCSLDVGRRRVSHGDTRPEGFSLGACGRRWIDYDYVGADSGGNHDRRQTHPTSSKDSQLLAFDEPGLRGKGVEGGSEAAAEAGGGEERETIGKTDKIGVGVMNDDLFGEGPETGEARLLLGWANLGLPTSTE